MGVVFPCVDRLHKHRLFHPKMKAAGKNLKACHRPTGSGPANQTQDGDLISGATFSISNPTLETAVPEPSTWAMMNLGFAGIGAMTYRPAQERDARGLISNRSSRVKRTLG
jgi:hypothetical protein